MMMRLAGEAHGGQSRLHPLAAFAHRLVGQADEVKGGQASGDLALHLDRPRLQTLKCHGGDECDQGGNPFGLG